MQGFFWLIVIVLMCIGFWPLGAVAFGLFLVVCVASAGTKKPTKKLSDKPISAMTDEELEDEINTMVEINS